jgi:hypothetical protein
MSECIAQETDSMAVCLQMMNMNMFPRVQRSPVGIVRRVQISVRQPREVFPSEQQAMKKTREASANRDE